MTNQQIYYKKLAKILKAACHGKGCLYLYNCPNQCQCRKNRTFKLNTETAICWILANSINCNVYNMRKQIKIGLAKRMKAYHDLSVYHMSEGWINFFGRVSSILEMLSFNRSCDNSNISNELEKLQNNVNRLKRDKK